MPRIAGVNVPDKKPISIALTYIYGIGKSSSLRILKEANIDPQKKAFELQPEEINVLKNIIEKNYVIEGDLRQKIQQNIKHYKEIGSWRGYRHIKGLPVRGQNTRINSRTVRGNVRRTMGSGRRPPPSPT